MMTSGRADFDAAAGEASEGGRDRRPEDRLAAGQAKGDAAVDGKRAEGRDERQDADIGDEKAVDEPPARPTKSAAGTATQGGPPATKISAATMPARLAIEPMLRSKSPIAITTVIVAEPTASILICWVMLRRLREVTKVSGKSTRRRRSGTRKPNGVP